MKMTIDANMMKEAFRNLDRDYYTYEACGALLNYYDEVDETMEFDPIAICCDWNEYGDTPCLKWSNFLNDFDYILEDLDLEEDATEQEKIDEIISELEDRTTVIQLSDSVLVQEF